MKIGTLAIVILLIASLSTQGSSLETSPYPPNVTPTVPIHPLGTNYTQYDALVIIGNSELIAASSRGSGTLGDPLIIDGLNITTNAHSIVIANTSLYLTITNCFLRSENFTSGFGIYLENSSHVTIDETQVLLKQVGIGIYGCTDITISESVVRYCDSNGLLIWGESSNILVVRSSIGGCDDTGIQTLLAENVTITETVLEACRVGLNIEYSKNISAANNDFHENTYGTILKMSDHCNLISNTYENNGLEVLGNETYGYDHVILDNTVNDLPLKYLYNRINEVVNCDGFGQVILAQSHNVTLHGGILRNSTIGIEVVACTDATVEWAILIGQSTAGVMIDYSTNCKIVYSLFWAGEYGVWMHHDTSINVTDSVFLYQKKAGVLSVNTENCKVSGNLIEYAHNGIEMYYTHLGTVSGNIIRRNLFNGIYLERCVLDEVILNEVSSNGHDGISMYETANMLVAGNEITDNSAGMFAAFANTIVVAGNLVHNNSGSGIYLMLADNLTIFENIAVSNLIGIRVSQAGSGIIYNNTLAFNSIDGISLFDVTNFDILHNIIFNNSIGLDLETGTANNSIYANTFYFNDHHNAHDNGANNCWDNGVVGNFWDDVSLDVYLISGTSKSVDHHPGLYNTTSPTTLGTSFIPEANFYLGLGLGLGSVVAIVLVALVYHRYHT